MQRKNENCDKYSTYYGTRSTSKIHHHLHFIEFIFLYKPTTTSHVQIVIVMLLLLLQYINTNQRIKVYLISERKTSELVCVHVQEYKRLKLLCVFVCAAKNMNGYCNWLSIARNYNSIRRVLGAIFKIRCCLVLEVRSGFKVGGK